MIHRATSVNSLYGIEPCPRRRRPASGVQPFHGMVNETFELVSTTSPGSTSSGGPSASYSDSLMPRPVGSGHGQRGVDSVPPSLRETTGVTTSSMSWMSSRRTCWLTPGPIVVLTGVAPLWSH
jgi:hypothetical protein